MQIEYSVEGRPFLVDSGRVWTKSGRYVGMVRSGLVFGPDGRYVGEFHNERLAFRRSNSSKRISSHMPRANRCGTATANRLRRSMTGGYEEFHG